MSFYHFISPRAVSAADLLVSASMDMRGLRLRTLEACSCFYSSMVIIVPDTDEKMHVEEVHVKAEESPSLLDQV